MSVYLTISLHCYYIRYALYDSNHLFTLILAVEGEATRRREFCEHYEGYGSVCACSEDAAPISGRVSLGATFGITLGLRISLVYFKK